MGRRQLHSLCHVEVICEVHVAVGGRLSGPADRVEIRGDVRVGQRLLCLLLASRQVVRGRGPSVLYLFGGSLSNLKHMGGLSRRQARGPCALASICSAFFGKPSSIDCLPGGNRFKVGRNLIEETELYRPTSKQHCRSLIQGPLSSHHPEQNSRPSGEKSLGT